MPPHRQLLPAVAGLVALDVVGGSLAVATGRNTVAEAWSGRAVLAAPLPMIVAQLGLSAAADRWADRRGAAAAGLLGAACLVSGASGFFDGQLGRADLPRGLVAFQVVLVGATVVVGTLSLRRARWGRLRGVRRAGAAPVGDPVPPPLVPIAGERL